MLSEVCKFQIKGVVQVIETLAQADGIGNIVLNLDRAFRRERLPTQILALTEYRNSDHEPVRKSPSVLKSALTHFVSERYLVLYHYGASSSILDPLILDLPPDICIFYFHNVTPSHYWRYWSRDAHNKCLMAEKELHSLAKAGFTITGDSLYNIACIQRIFPTRRIAPVLPPSMATARQTAARSPNHEKAEAIRLVFVGRFAPNKRQDLLLHLAYCLKLLAIPYHLTLVGNYRDRFGQYVLALRNFYGLKSEVSFLTGISEAEIQSLYCASDFFIAATEHEGYCMPVADALEQRLVPIMRPIPVFLELFGSIEAIAPDMSDLGFVKHAISIIMQSREAPDFKEELLRRLISQRSKSLKNYLTAQKFAKYLKKGRLPKTTCQPMPLSPDPEDRPSLLSNLTDVFPRRIRFAMWLKSNLIESSFFFYMSALCIKLLKLWRGMRKKITVKNLI